MPELIIKLEGDGALNDVPTESVVHVTAPVTVTALDRGMTSGKPSMAFIIPLPNGQTVLAETSMALFHAAAKAFAARYGWQAQLMAENRIVPFNETNLTVITEKRNHLLSLATALTISDAKSYEFACELAKGISGLRTSIVDEFAEEKDRRYKAHRAVCDLEKRYLDGVVEPDKIVRGKITAWNVEQDTLQREQERIAREQAQREAEDRRLEEAQRAHAQGRPDVAEKILEAPIVPAPITMPRIETPKVSGVAIPKVWDFKIVDPQLVPDAYKTIDQAKIRKVVQALKENTSIPGVEVFSTLSTRIGGRKQPTSEPTSATTPVTAQASGEDLW